ncbi:MAG: ferrous iron transporter B, partial [Planctomycetota bacterium]
MSPSLATDASVDRPTVTAPAAEGTASPRTIALLGSPNTGKTTLFNRLTGLRQKTANFPGTTLEAHVGTTRLDAAGPVVRLIDLPGVYALDLDSLEARVCREALAGRVAAGGAAAPEAVCVLLDAAALRQSLRFLARAMATRLPMVVALTMTDIARRKGVEVDAAALSRRLGCPVVTVNPRSGEGLERLRTALRRPAPPVGVPPADPARLRTWVDELQALAVARAPTEAVSETFVDRLDRAFTHPVLGVGLFAAIMLGLFWLLFRIAVYPMDWIELAFAHVSGFLEAALPAGALRDLLASGVAPGVAGALVFLPQICLLFFLLSILEDTGYLARAAFVADRVLRRFGLPGHAFIPLLSSHACAIPGIMAARAIPNRRDRLATILVAPFMTCSARLPVYALLSTLLFPHAPSRAALAFAGCYALGAFAGAGSALLARGTILKGPGAAMALELPSYKWPSLRTALLTAYDRGMLFLKKAGVFIALFSIVLWWLTSYPL